MMHFIQDECSFVSLRDVVRAMIVFEWFYDKTRIIEHELSKQEGYKVTITCLIVMPVNGHVQLYSHLILF